MTDTLVVDRIESNLTRLRLPRIREILEGVLNASEKKDARMIRSCFLSRKIMIVYGNEMIHNVWWFPVSDSHLHQNSDVKHTNTQ